MNLQNKQNTYFFLIISLLLTLNCNAQTVNDVVDFADRQFEVGNYTIASKEYNRAFFFGYEKKDELSMKIAQCYTYMNEYTLAADFYDKAYRFASCDSIRNEAVLNKAFNYIIDKQFMIALAELFNISDSTTYNQQIEYHFLKAIAHYGSFNDSLAQFEFTNSAVAAKLDSTTLLKIKHEFAEIENYTRRYKPGKVYLMSVIPGLGQTWVGSAHEGINSALLLGGLFVLTIRTMVLYSFWDGAIMFMPWLQRYYMGGMDRAKQLATQRIEKERGQTLVNVMDITTPPTY